MRPKREFVARAPHHAYIGLMLLFLGWTMDPHAIYGYLSEVFMVVGLLVTLDDVVEHTYTEDTPIRLLAEKWMFPFLRKYVSRKN